MLKRDRAAAEADKKSPRKSSSKPIGLAGLFLFASNICSAMVSILHCMRMNAGCLSDLAKLIFNGLMLLVWFFFIIGPFREITCRFQNLFGSFRLRRMPSLPARSKKKKKSTQEKDDEEGVTFDQLLRTLSCFVAICQPVFAFSNIVSHRKCKLISYSFFFRLLVSLRRDRGWINKS